MHRSFGSALISAAFICLSLNNSKMNVGLLLPISKQAPVISIFTLALVEACLRLEFACAFKDHNMPSAIAPLNMHLKILILNGYYLLLAPKRTLLMFTAWLQLDYRKILCNFCPLEFTRGPNGKCFNQEFALAFMGKCYK